MKDSLQSRFLDPRIECPAIGFGFTPDAMTSVGMAFAPISLLQQGRPVKSHLR
jgi:hypothetical protein